MLILKESRGMLNLLIQYFMFWRKLEYHYFIIGGVTIFSRYGSIYRFTNDTSVWRKELSSFCRMASWSIYYLRIFLRLSHIYHHTLLHCRNLHKESTVHCLKRYSLFLHHSYKSSTDIRWNRFIWVQSNPCFTVLHWKNKSKEKKVHQTIVRSWCTETNIICAVKIRRVLL